jgi:hypothetical protein
MDATKGGVCAMTVVVQSRPIRVSREVDAQAETFWTAFQALLLEVQWVVRERLARAEMVSPALAAELESWQSAGSEALMTFEAMLNDTSQ